MSRISQTWAVVAVFGLLTGGGLAAGAEPPRSDEPIAKSPDASLRSIQVRDGFTVELVAAEPLVMDPIALDWGSDGKLWVVEMGDYPLDSVDQGKAGGRVRVLEDTDNDGKYDKSTVFLDNLVYPTGVTVWHKGILVSAAPDVFYAEDTNGDGKADKREVLYSGFIRGNPQHRVNGFSWGLDNWLYLANGDSGGVVKSLKSGKMVRISGRDLRVRPDDGSLDPQTGGSQFGRNRDDWGNWFGSYSLSPIMHFALADHYLRRNPEMTAPPGRITIASSDNTVIYPISRVISHWKDYRPPEPNEPHRFGAACSTIVYRDDLFGEAFRNSTFTCEPAYNLVHRRVLQPSGVTFTSARAAGEEQSEFLASSDNWFRPTALRTGPDGALWVADMYRLVIEHPDWIDDHVEETLDLRSGHDKGRIYRVFPTGKRPRPIPRLDQMQTAGLVAALDSPNGWQRDQAQQMLIWRGDQSAKQLLIETVSHCRRPLGRLHALCTLDGLGLLTTDVLTIALSDAHPGVRRHAVRLTKTLPSMPAATAAALLKRVDDDDVHVRLECAYALGYWDAPQAGRALGQMALRHADDPYVFAAVMSSLSRRNLDQVLAEVFVGRAGRIPAGPLTRRLLSLATAWGEDEVLVRTLGIVSAPTGQRYSLWQLSALGGILDTLERRKTSLAQLRRAANAELQPVLERIARMFAVARQIAANDKAELAERQLAVQLLGRGPDRQNDVNALGRLLVPQTPGELQLAVVKSLGKLHDDRVPDVLVAGWKGHGPQIRRAILDELFSRETWQLSLLTYVEEGSIGAREIDAARRHWLLTHKTTSLKKLAERVLATSVDPNRARVVESHLPALDMIGNRQRGAVVFSKRCSTCHRISELGHEVGPDLAALTNHSPRSLLDAILDPNQAVEDKFKNYVALTKDGRVFTGILTHESGNDITLVGQEGKRHVILRSELDELAATGQSSMPEGLENELKHQDLADLILYVATLGPPAKRFSGNKPQRVSAADDGCLTLRADEASIYGDTLVYQQQRRSLEQWLSKNDRVVWSLNVAQGGKFAALIDYAVADSNQGNRFSITAGDTQLAGSVESIEAANNYRQILVGHLNLIPGKQALTLRAAGKQSGPLMNFRTLWLVPVSGEGEDLPYRVLSGNKPRLVHSEDGTFRLRPDTCEIYGKTIQFEKNRQSLAFWSSESDLATWTLDVKKADTFVVFLDYACHYNAAGNTFTIHSGDRSLSGRIRSTGSWDNYRQISMASIELQPGKRRVTFRCSGRPSQCLIDLRELFIMPDSLGVLREEVEEEGKDRPDQ
jgi:putative membrane-bound dehydrogenase-like protein